MAQLTLVLLPGLDGTGDLFEPFVAALGDEFKSLVVRYPTDAALGYSELEHLVRQELPASEPFVLVGESFSGPIAVSIAANPPPNLTGVVLCCTFIRNPRPGLAVLRHFVHFANPKFGPLSVVCALLMGKHATPAWRSSLATALSKVSAAVFRARLLAVLDVNIADQLATVEVPVLYLRATQDRLVPEHASAEVVQALPSTAVVSIDGPHFLLQACPKQAITAISAFFRAAQEIKPLN